MIRVAILLVGCLLSGCASIYAGEMARDALAMCRNVESVDFRGGRVYDSASTVIRCR